MVPLLVDAAVPAPRPGVTPALAGIATVRELVGAFNADFCILANASASISVRDVVGLDDKRGATPVARDADRDRPLSDCRSVHPGEVSQDSARVCLCSAPVPPIAPAPVLLVHSASGRAH